MRIVFMVEERSMKELLEVLLPRILPVDVEPLIVTHNGKSDLQNSLPKKLRGWQSLSDRFVIVHDQDSNDCHKLKTALKLLCEKGRNDYLIRIVCIELESWYFGDLTAVSLAYGEDYAQLAAKEKFRAPDKIKNAKKELRKIVPTYQPIDGAKKIAIHMNIDNNTSPSFNVFVSGVKRICCIQK